ncbi:Riboflavin biosynthesis protein RibF [Corynebacterium kalinowskii]|uniref:Riboflavin biosynthesis protein n=1 Tax=Corynebacterium kalinowskii TaxID=2675216 RepID=A0A6B8VRK4_9CORY|nr:bifunctional riboflavin kinase/FAD synthetase [Corynebacterium kalinowskii]QGU02247.1 Riboflavin biosynthesis protein RibF [Corynebacterium kalinowskii]
MTYSLSVDIWHGLGDVAPAASVVTIGVFDGVHRGHQTLIGRAVTEATARDLRSVLLTFDPHPVAVIRPDKMPALLGTMTDRAARAEALGIDAMLAVPFTRDLAQLSPEEFFSSVLLDVVQARVIVVGENFTFGRMAAGDVNTLRELGEAHGVEVIVLPLLEEDGIRFSSTTVRGMLDSGDVSGAARVLGRPFSVSATVVRGAGRGGKELGFPTANMYFPDERALPTDGVYAGWFIIRSAAPISGDMEPGQRYPAAISVGTNPTFGDTRRSVETFVLDKHADLYGHDCEVEFIEHIRGMEKFTSVEELLSAMNRDVAEIRTVLGISSS